MPWAVDIVEVGVIPDLPYALYLPDAPADARLDVPCYAYLLTAKSHTALIDTGPDPDRAAQAGLVIHGHPQRALSQALEARGLTTDEVQLIIHTHLHYDHIQNDAMFPQAQIIVQRSELEWARSADADRFYVDIASFDQTARSRLTLVDGDYKPVEGIQLVANGGHTLGHQSILVTTPEGPAWICADIVPQKPNIATPAPSLDPAATQAFARRVLDSGWEYLPGHDPTLRQHRWYRAPSDANRSSRPAVPDRTDARSSR